MSDKFRAQESQYGFPYHYIPHFKGGAPRTTRTLKWGLEYLCYQQYLVERVRAHAPASVLDVGCGDGHLLGLLGDAVPVRVGVDLAAPAIRFARAFHPDVRFEVIDAAALAEQFELVISIEVLEHVPDEHVGAFLRALAARVRPGGTVLLSVPTVVMPVSAKHYRHYDRALLERQLAESGAALALDDVAYVYRSSPLVRGLTLAMHNGLFSIEIPRLQRLLWRYTWDRLRIASARDGNHLVATLRPR